MWGGGELRGNPREMWENGEMRTMGTEPKSRRTMTICGRWQLPKKHKKTEIVFHCAYVHGQKICVIYQKLKNLHYFMRKKTQSRSLASYASVDASFFDYFIFFFSVLYYTFCTVSANIFECVLVCRNWILVFHRERERDKERERGRDGSSVKATLALVANPICLN